MFKHLRDYFTRRKTAKLQAATSVVNQLLPSRPQVANHQKQAALHIQLAQEIGWKGAGR